MRSDVYKPAEWRWTRLTCAPALGLLLAVSAASAAEPVDGREYYKEECARCHGKHGEGGTKKYKRPLIGDWSVGRLARYIEKEMPDDDPGTIKPHEAAAVADYMHKAFYSREARERNQPGRVELVRLTNRQYLQTVADLMGTFTGSGTPGPERGLRATYRKTKNAGDRKNAREQVDPQVDFQFGANAPDGQPATTNGFSIEWKGSVIATETGEYAFTIKTPNGARLWVNDNETPLIDAYVSAGRDAEHQGTIRLIGGRAYPLRLEMFRFKEKTAGIALQWKPPRGVQQVIPTRCLAPDAVPATFVPATVFPPDDSSVGYERGVSVSKEWDEAATRAAIEAANHVVQRLDAFAGSTARDTNRAAKVEAFCRRFVETAFRRPLDEDQRKLYVAGHFKAAPDLEAAVKRVVILALKSPRFLYLGLADAKPDDYEVASRLSFGLWDSLPDRELLQQAAAGKLREPGPAAAQAERMLRDPRTRSKMRDFLHHWLQMDRVEDVNKDPALFPGFTPEIVDDLKVSLDLFLDDVVWGGASDYRQLLESSSLFLNARLAEFYGVPANAGGGFSRVAFDPKQRSGVLTHPYLLAAFSYHKSTSPIHRGVFLTRNIVGRELQPPPIAVAFKDSEFKPGMTMREKVEELTRPSACQVCHAVINPLGFSLEHYDAVGRFRLREGDRPVNATTELPAEEGDPIRLNGPRDIATYAAGSAQAQGAFVEQLFHQVVKQPMSAYGRSTADRLLDSFAASQFNIQRLLVEIAVLSSLHGTGARTAAAETAVEQTAAVSRTKGATP